jgi:hypothetical protein
VTGFESREVEKARLVVSTAKLMRWEATDTIVNEDSILLAKKLKNEMMFRE